jgi:hypothetical protein
MDSNLIFILVTAGLFAYALYRVWQIVELFLRRIASGSWQTTTGKVNSREVSVHTGGRGGKSYTPKITYSYSVMGERYKKTISLGTMLWKSSAEKAIDEVENSLEVRYNPEKPNVNFTDLEKISFYDLFSVLLILIVAVGFLIGILSGVPINGGHK